MRRLDAVRGVLDTTAMNGGFESVQAASGLDPYAFENVVRYLELRHAVLRRTIAGSVFLSPTIEMGRVMMDLADDDGFAAIAYHRPGPPAAPSSPLVNRDTVREVADVFRQAGRPAARTDPTLLRGDEQLALVDEATIRAESSDDDRPEPEYALRWEDREWLFGEMDSFLAERFGRACWQAERAALEQLFSSATEGLCARSDAYGEDAYLDMGLVVYGRILADAPRRTLPEAVLRAYRAGAWPRGYDGAYPRGRILCVPFQ